MDRYFNTEGLCDPAVHYMVRLDDRLNRIKQSFIDRGKYFVINRGRQYGKTTTIKALAEYLRPDYLVISMDFQEIGTDEFRNEAAFSRAFAEILTELFQREYGETQTEAAACLSGLAEQRENLSLRELFLWLSEFCTRASKPVVLIIDEVDSASNHQVFLDFLALLRKYYLSRKDKAAFHSVILAGVYDIKNLKLKIRPETDHKYNSPWNIAARFNVEMSFSAEEISAMLQEYEEDHRTGMDVEAVGGCIYEYTSGYPYLVSAICRFLDEDILGDRSFEDAAKVWTRAGVTEAVKLLLSENTPLFDSMVKQIDIYKDLRNMLQDILYLGKQIPYNPYVESMNLGIMFGFLKEAGGCIVAANRIFEMGLLNLFIAEEAVRSEAFRYGQMERPRFVTNCSLNMDLVLEKFVTYFTEIYGKNDQKFVEAQGRKLFLLYLKPIINGVGNYYLEAQTRDMRRTDVVVDYLGEQFVIELKIWHGSEYNERGEKQLTDYLDYFRLQKGYMLSFNFNQNKVPGVKEIRMGEKTIIEAVV